MHYRQQCISNAKDVADVFSIVNALLLFVYMLWHVNMLLAYDIVNIAQLNEVLRMNGSYVIQVSLAIYAMTLVCRLLKVKLLYGAIRFKYNISATFEQLAGATVLAYMLYIVYIIGIDTILQVISVWVHE